MNGQNGTFFKRTSFNLRTQPRERNAFLPAMSHKGGRKVMRQRNGTPQKRDRFVLCLTEMIDEENGKENDDNSNVRQLKRSLAVVTYATRWEETKRERSVQYLISFVGFGLIPVAVAVLVVDEQSRASVEHQLLVGQVLQVQVPDAIEITQASLQPVFRQILTCLRWTREKMEAQSIDQVSPFKVYNEL